MLRAASSVHLGDRGGHFGDSLGVEFCFFDEMMETLQELRNMGLNSGIA